MFKTKHQMKMLDLMYKHEQERKDYERKLWSYQLKNINLKRTLRVLCDVIHQSLTSEEFTINDITYLKDNSGYLKDNSGSVIISTDKGNLFINRYVCSAAEQPANQSKEQGAELFELVNRLRNLEDKYDD
jgi:hypothetical protein